MNRLLKRPGWKLDAQPLQDALATADERIVRQFIESMNAGRIELQRGTVVRRRLHTFGFHLLGGLTTMSKKLITDVPTVPPEKRVITDAPSQADPQVPPKPLVEPAPKEKPLIDIPPKGKPLNE